MHFYYTMFYRFCRYYDYELDATDEQYTNDLLLICSCYGVAREDVELLLEFGYSCDEIEEMLFDTELFEETMREIKSVIC